MSLMDLKHHMARSDLPRSQKYCELEHRKRAASLYDTTFLMIWAFFEIYLCGARHRALPYQPSTVLNATLNQKK